MKNDQVEKGERPERDFLPRMGAGCLVALGAMTALLSIPVLADEKKDALLGFLFFLLFGGGMIAAGIFWYRYIRTRDEQQIDRYEDRMLLGLAARHGGHLTLAIVALESTCSAAQAESAMARMVRQGFAQPELMEDGTVRYRFGGLIDGGEE
jgi:hypothetical protein